MLSSSLIQKLALFSATATAQLVTYTSGGHGLSVNVPEDTASSGSGPIFFQIVAPSGTSWVSFGQGTRMANSNMFVVYSRDSTNVTISGRAGTGHNMPQHDPSIQLSLLEGSNILPDGTMVANVRCDNCNEWNGGSMSFTDSSSTWIYASLSGSAMDTDDVSAVIRQHSSDTAFTLDLTAGTGGSSTNPFFTAAEETSDEPLESATATDATPTVTASQNGGVSTPQSTGGVSVPVAGGSGSTSSDSSSSRETSDNTGTLLSAHGIIMSVLFLALFPLAALTLYLPTAIKVRYIHAPLQVIATILLIAGMALGIILANRIGEIDGYHQIIGFIIVAALVLFQPAMGIYQHLHYHKTGGKSAFGVAHRWLGRSMIMLGIVNGGLGFMIAGNTSAYLPYGIVAGLIFLVYLSVLLFAWYRGEKKAPDSDDEKSFARDRNYEIQPGRKVKHKQLPSDTRNAYGEQQPRTNAGRSHEYTVNARQ